MSLKNDIYESASQGADIGSQVDTTDVFILFFPKVRYQMLFSPFIFYIFVWLSRKSSEMEKAYKIGLADFE